MIKLIPDEEVITNSSVLFKDVILQAEQKIVNGGLSVKDRKKNYLLLATPGCGKTTQAKYHQHSVEQEGKGCLFFDFKENDSEFKTDADIEVAMVAALLQMVKRVNPAVYDEQYEDGHIESIARVISDASAKKDAIGSIVEPLLKSIKSRTSVSGVELVYEGLEYMNPEVQQAFGKYIDFFDKTILMVDEEHLGITGYDERRKFEDEHDMAIVRLSYTHDSYLTHTIVEKRAREVAKINRLQFGGTDDSIMDREEFRIISEKLGGNLRLLTDVVMELMDATLVSGVQSVDQVMSDVDFRVEQTRRESSANRGKYLSIYSKN